jgi:GTP pyrophosphokinase/guanosine-3',5'-bis(diphosphate) 3'-pyrophosphohydrolase
VREAYRFADEAHLGQFRASGEAYITHPIAVAGPVRRVEARCPGDHGGADARRDGGLRHHQGELIERFGAPTADSSTA